MCIHIFFQGEGDSGLACGSSGSHLDKDKTLVVVEEIFYWPLMRHDVAKFV